VISREKWRPDRGKPAFTLVEIVVVIAVLVILLVAGVGLLGGTGAQARRAGTDMLSGMIEQARTSAITTRSFVVLAVAEPGDLPAGDERCRIGLFKVENWPENDTDPLSAVLMSRWRTFENGVVLIGGDTGGLDNPLDQQKLKSLTAAATRREPSRCMASPSIHAAACTIPEAPCRWPCALRKVPTAVARPRPTAAAKPSPKTASKSAASPPGPIEWTDESRFPHAQFARGVTLVESVIAVGVLAVAVPLVFGALAEAGKTGLASQAETRSTWMIPACIDEIQASRDGRPQFFTATTTGQSFPPAGDVWALAFSPEGRPVGRLSKALHDKGTKELDGKPIRFIAVMSAGEPDHLTRRPDDAAHAHIHRVSRIGTGRKTQQTRFPYPHPMRPAPRKSPGFTLVELLSSMVIGSIILLAAASLLGSSGDGYERVGGGVATEREARALVTQLTSDLATARFHKDGVIEASTKSWPDDRLGFLSLQPVQAQSDNGRIGDLCAVHYYIDDITIGGKTVRCLMRGFRESVETFKALESGTARPGRSMSGW
jgi:prepilin-type N-terminal cleavage/methylation domain-containing protein